VAQEILLLVVTVALALTGNLLALHTQEAEAVVFVGLVLEAQAVQEAAVLAQRLQLQPPLGRQIQAAVEAVADT
tara:strand:- start:148 stop:369 length:222 start_codon:yes stop_codon:yes gene_type:complete